MTATRQLFSITSTIPVFRDHSNVAIGWFVRRRTQPVARRYSNLIENYDALPTDARLYPEGAVDELFTRQEADALAAWLREHRHDLSAKVDQVNLPIPANIIGLGAVPCGGGVDCLLLGTEEGCPLEVGGFFDLRQHERAPAAADGIDFANLPF